jgi:hypothetical protein
MTKHWVLALLVFLSSSCIMKSGNQDSELDDVASPGMKVVRVFSKTLVDVDKRGTYITAQFPPAAEEFSSIELELTLSCPNGKCDWWDRPGELQIITDQNKPEKNFEILRFMTPYRVGGTWSMDVSHLRPLLTGNVKFWINIMTGVKEGHPNGDGWLVTTKFKMKRGTPEKRPVAVVPLLRSQYIEYGNPTVNSTARRNVFAPAGLTFSSARVFSTITGHGQGNRFNCAEFCDKIHSMTVAGQTQSTRIYRTDCKDNPISNQAGTWQADRAGWCPGDIVKPWTFELAPGSIGTDAAFQAKYFPEPYLNTCRPGLAQCTQCELDSTCEYNGKNHTMARWWVSSYLVLYE